MSIELMAPGFNEMPGPIENFIFKQQYLLNKIRTVKNMVSAHTFYFVKLINVVSPVSVRVYTALGPSER